MNNNELNAGGKTLTRTLNSTQRNLIAKWMLFFGILLNITITFRTYGQQYNLNITTANAAGWTVNCTDVLNGTPYVISGGYFGSGSLSVSSSGNGSGVYINGGDFQNFDGFYMCSYTFELPLNATNIVLTFTNLTVDDACVLYLNNNPIASTETDYSDGAPSGFMVLSDGLAATPWIFSGPNGALSGTVTNYFIPGAQNTLTAVINNTGSGASGSLEHGLRDNTFFTFNGTVSASDQPSKPSISLIKAVEPVFSNLLIGTNYQLQISSDMNTWTNQGNPFTATNPSVAYPQYFDLNDWNQLFFRLQVVP